MHDGTRSWLISDTATTTPSTASAGPTGGRPRSDAPGTRGPAAPAPGSVPLRVVPGSRTPAAELTATVGVALHALANLRRPHPAATSGQLEAMLRTAVNRAATGSAESAPAAAAVRVACAFLAARDLREAHLALLTARDTVSGALPVVAPAAALVAEPVAELLAEPVAERERAVS